ncbi:MAG: hypothetical protein HYY04_16240, partial [Chloroflexi bacterium]|nr:hypothetical protein [Chloroflexota bacterium]
VKGVLAQGQAPNAKEAREAKRQRREEGVKEAAAISQGTDRAKIEERRDAFVAKWQESESEAVATLLRDFDQTLVSLEVHAAAAKQGDDGGVRYLRTTSLLERLNRTLREMADRVVLLHSEDGLDARVDLLLLQAGGIVIPRDTDWLEVLEEALAAA